MLELNKITCVDFFQVDLVAQGDSVYDIIDASDHFTMRTNLSTSTSLEIGKTNSTTYLTNVAIVFDQMSFDFFFLLTKLVSSPLQIASSAVVSTPPSPCGGRAPGTSWF